MEFKRIVGVYDHEDPPVPIPNTAVKLMCAENTWLETTREDKSMPTHGKGPLKVLFLQNMHH